MEMQTTGSAEVGLGMLNVLKQRWRAKDDGDWRLLVEARRQSAAEATTAAAHARST
jgi:hypothetical protein